MNNDYFEEYKLLIQKADAYFDVWQGSTHNKEQDVIQTFYEQTLSYNGYLSTMAFKAKLKSLSVLLAFELEQSYELKGLGLSSGRDLVEELQELEDNFINVNGVLKHKKFILTRPTRSKHIHIEQSHFQEFITIAYDDLKGLNSSFDIHKQFQNLFIGNAEEVDRNIKRVDNALFELGLVDNRGTSLIQDRKKGILWAFIDELIAKKLIKILTEQQYITIMWKYIKGNGKPPIKPHRETYIYKDFKLFVEKYFK